MQDNQQNQENQMYMQLTEKSSDFGNQQSNEQMNSLQEYPKPSDFPSNSPQNLNCPPNQQINNYVLPPLIQSEGEKLIINFALLKNIIVEVCLLIMCGFVIGFVFVKAKIYISIFFVIEHLFILFLADKKIEIIKDVPNKKLRVNLVNYLCCAKKKREFTFPNIYADVRIIKGDKDTSDSYNLVLINSFKDGIDIDLDSSNIQNLPLTIFYVFENVSTYKFNGQFTMKQTINTFLGNSNDETNPLSFNINKYMNKEQNIFSSHVTGRGPFNKYVKMNDHFFSYYTKDPLYDKRCIIFVKLLLILYHIALAPLAVVFGTGSENTKEKYSPFEKKEKYTPSEKETYLYLGVFGLFGCCIILYLIILGIRFCCDRTNEYLRIDIIYSKNFDRLFIGVVKNNGKEYLKKVLFNLNEIDKFVIQKNNINDKGFHLKSMNKGNNLIQDICHIKEEQDELEGLLYILNEKLSYNANNNYNHNITDNNNNLDINTNNFPPSTTPLIYQP